MLKTIFKVVTVLRTDVRGKTSSWTGSVNAEVSDKRGSTLYLVKTGQSLTDDSLNYEALPLNLILEQKPLMSSFYNNRQLFKKLILTLKEVSFKVVQYY